MRLSELVQVVSARKESVEFPGGGQAVSGDRGNEASGDTGGAIRVWKVDHCDGASSADGFPGDCAAGDPPPDDD